MNCIVIHRSTLNICHQYVLGSSLFIKRNGITVIIYLMMKGTELQVSVNYVSKYIVAVSETFI